MTWLGLAAPGWLAGLAALAVPLAIHLLSRGRQRRMAMGSTRWLAPAETLRARRLRPSRWWLLALRCMLLAVVVLALAGPRWALRPRTEAARWLLIEPEVLTDRARLEPGNEAAYRALDEAVAAGGERHLLAPAGNARPATAAPERAAEADLWSLLRELDAAAPPAAPFSVFTLERQSALAGARPDFGRDLSWHRVVDGRANRWLERVLATENGRLAVIVGSSDEAGTRFAALAEAAASEGLPGLAAERRPDGWHLALAAGGSVTADDRLVAAPVPPLEALLLAAGERIDDGRYVRAALAAAAAAASRPLVVHDGADDRLPETLDLVFWLSEEPVPRRLLERLARGGALVSDALGRFETCDARLWVGGAEPLVIERCGELEAGGESAATLWASAEGRPLLVGERVGAGRWLRFASRFDPASNDLVLSPAFPAWLLELVEQAAPRAASARLPESDRRPAGGQGEPRHGVASDRGREGRELPASAGLWLLVLAAAGGERWLAARGAR